MFGHEVGAEMGQSDGQWVYKLHFFLASCSHTVNHVPTDIYNL